MNLETVTLLLKNFNIQAFQHDLVRWFDEEKRDLPWRQNKDPYRVWISEIMLQQTKVDTVIPYFERFIEKFPTLDRLAAADEQEVLKAWEGLGYYSRARNLQHAVREVVSTYNSKVPNNPEQLGTLKGVGPYTKGAILSIAYGLPEPAVDGNVMRVLARILHIEEDISKQSVRRLVEECVKQIISEGKASEFNQGLMELGALICTPKAPSCMHCPVQAHCRAYEAGTEKTLPIKAKAKKQKSLDYFSLVIKDNQDNYLIEKRPSEGLLANMWQFPMVSKSDANATKLTEWFLENYGIKLVLKDTLTEIKHVFSHVIWHIDVLEAEVLDGELKKELATFVPQATFAEYPFPVPHLKIQSYL
ncbi:A/G-specific adenine glycosylase [Radiobacillus sp. PE A8.2]|uniref:A/G-specific adenine glycosylase n=1 Tax=Radiobacillus sp. PE A8.2 TaxID=3380349 RepID=UPI0038907AA1